jgi:hypothetical protein
MPARSSSARYHSPRGSRFGGAKFPRQRRFEATSTSSSAFHCNEEAASWTRSSVDTSSMLGKISVATFRSLRSSVMSGIFRTPASAMQEASVSLIRAAQATNASRSASVLRARVSRNPTARRAAVDVGSLRRTPSSSGAVERDTGSRLTCGVSSRSKLSDRTMSTSGFKRCGGRLQRSPPAAACRPPAESDAVLGRLHAQSPGPSRGIPQTHSR